MFFDLGSDDREERKGETSGGAREREMERRIGGVFP